MVCSSCGAANKESAKFCAECGHPLAAACPSCAAPVGADQRFCDECGTALVATAVPRMAPDTAVAAPAATAERRVCSVLFADLVGFTSLSESRDPEAVRELLTQYFETARTVIGRYGGVVEKFIGDAVMAVWGTPTAAEGDAERAVRAGLELVDAVAELGREENAPGLAARAGIVTGQVAVTLGADGQGMVAGDAVNTASRVQSAAEPGTVLVDQGTWRMAHAAVHFADAGSRDLKGKAEPVALWRAERVLSGVGGSQRVDGLEAPFSGRDSELRLVKDLFHTCEQRRAPRLVSVTGAAGVGKTRLGWEFFKYIDGLKDTVLWHRGRCLSYGDGVAFWALAEMVRQRMGIAEEDPVEVAAEKLANGLQRWVPDPAERAYVLPRLAQLLGTGLAAGGQGLGRDELFAGWRLFLERLATEAPVVLLVEDLQHADSGLLDFFEHLLDWARDVPVFLLTLARPELETLRVAWGTGRRNSTALSLEPLPPASMAALIEGLVPGMPGSALTAIAGRAEGIPLYAVETVRMLIDRDVVQPIDGVYRLVGDVGDLAVPETLQSLLAARLDALEPELRRLVADAAVLGGSFPREALVAVSGLPVEEVDRALAELVRREVLGVRADPLSPQRGQYAFVQTMLRQVAYDTLSRRERKSRHLAVADHLVEAFAGTGEEISEVIAAHLLDALTAVPDDPDVPALRTRTVEMLTRAAERATRTGAPLSAARSYAAAAELLAGTQDLVDELAAAHLLEQAGQAVRDAVPDVAMTHLRRAGELYRRHGRERDAARADTRVAAAMGWTGEHGEARELLLRAVAVLEPDPDQDTVEAVGQLAGHATFSGAADADALCSASLELAQAIGVEDDLLGQLLLVRGIGFSFADRNAEAVAYLREALRLADLAHDSFQAGRVQLNLAEIVSTIDPVAAAAAARSAVAHCRRVGASLRLGVASANLVLALIYTGDWAEALEVHRSGVEDDRLGGDVTLAWSAVILHTLRGDQAAVARALPLLDTVRGSEDPQQVAGLATAEAAAATCRGDLAAALAHGREALPQAAAIGLRADGVRWAWPFAAQAAVSMGDAVAARELFAWLDAYQPGKVPAVLRAERLRAEARLLSGEGDPSAGAAFELSTRTLRELGYPYHLAAGLVDHAEHLQAAGDGAAAAALAEEGLALAVGLGAAPLVDRATRLGSVVPAD